ncbi:MAG: hydroxymethylpyrimidine/phosphomethylpyrimidine kinase [Bradymonadaceae bacterium]
MRSDGAMKDEPDTLLTIAGTDPSGGAGIPVDLQVFRDFGFHGASAVSAIVVQNTAEVRRFEPVEPGLLGGQLEAVTDDLELAGVKIGMLPTAAAVERLAGWLSAELTDVPVVVDPVMASGTGDARLNREGTVRAMIDSLLPRVDWLTPNVPEAERFLDREVVDRAALHAAAADLRELGPERVLLKSGHLPHGDAEGFSDVLAGPEETIDLEMLPAVDADVRGTGCQLSSALVAVLADGDGRRTAVERARRYLNRLSHEQIARVGQGRPVVVRGRAPFETPAEG